MGIRDYVDNIKQKAYDFKDKRDQQNAIRQAKQLKTLRERRIKAEGRAKIYTAKEKEENKLKKANDKVKKNSPFYKLQEKVKKNRKKRGGFGTLPGQLRGGL